MAREHAQRRFMRQWRIVDALRASRRGRTVAEIAAHVEISRAQAYRELQVLLGSPLPIIVEKRNGTSFYRIERLELASTRDLIAIATARNALASLEGTELVDQLDRFLGKPVASPLAAESEAVTHEPEHVRALEKAIFGRVRVRLDYPREGRAGVRIVEPVELRHAQKAWYLTAWDVEGGRWKTFKLARIRGVEVLTERQTHPPYDAASMYGHSVSIWSGETYDVVIEVSAAEAHFAREHPLHPSQATEALDDGGLRVRATVAGLDEVTRWVLRFGKEAVAVAPTGLVERVRTQVDGASARYRKDLSPHVRTAGRGR